jgi:hypothetical protein
MDIHRPVVVPDNKEGVETLFTAQLLDTSPDENALRARFSYYVCLDQDTGTMVHTCSGEFTVHFDTVPISGAVLPPRDPEPANLVPVDGDLVYSTFENMGLKYTGAFRSITESRRCLNYATSSAAWADGALSDRYVVHPAMLDVAFQTLFLARAHPASCQVASPLLPSHIDRVRVCLSAQILKPSDGGQVKADFETWAVHQSATMLTGDLNVYEPTSGNTFVQVEGLETKMVGEQDASRDRPVFSKTVWGNDVSLGLVDLECDATKDSELLRLTEALERAALFYVRRLLDEIGTQDRSGFQWYHQRMLEAFEGHLALVRSGKHSVLQTSWLSDTPAALQDLHAQYPDSIEFKMIGAVGNNYADVVRGEAQLLEVVRKDDMLNRFYMEDAGCIRINQLVARAQKQISFKFPRCNILEIGAGTGGTVSGNPQLNPWCQFLT